MDGAQDFFGIIHIDVAKNWKTQKTHALLAVHEKNDPGVSLALEPRDEPLPRRLQKTLLENRLKRREHKKHPNDIARCHSHLSLRNPDAVGVAIKRNPQSLHVES